MHHDDAIALLDRAPTITVAGAPAGDAPLLRIVHGVVVDGWLAFHGGPKGAKTGLVGQPVVIAAHETLAVLPSWWFHAERACPATTWYRSVEVHGVLREIDDPTVRAAALQRLMRRLQPEGRHRPVAADDPMYREVVAGLLIAGVRLDDVRGKDKRGQGKRPALVRRVLDGLWERGAPGDLAALESIREARPDVAVPRFEAPGASLHVQGGERWAHAAAQAVADAYWNAPTDGFAGHPVDRLAAAHLDSSAWVFAVHDDVLVATARATGDGAKAAWVYDVWVAPDRRGTGLGTAVMRLLLDHPAVRRASRVHLATRDAGPFYARLGFRLAHTQPVGSHTREFWTLTRS